jgi:geranylgeranyl diphosphate synthase, type II
MGNSLESLSQGELAQLIRTQLLASLSANEAISDPFLANFASLLQEYPSRKGKTWRGLLTCLVARIHGGEISRAIPFAAALELFQNWIIVHDDIEDDSDERRGKPTLHQLAGLPIALNVGDGMHAYMWGSLLKAGYTQEILSEFVTIVKTTTEGQHIELSWIRSDKWDISENDYFEMARRKGAYYTTVAPLRLGALIAGISPLERYFEIGMELGVAYQLRDDVLNLVGDFREYGKEIAGDLWEGKRTLILLSFLHNASSEVKTRAHSILGKSRAEKTKEEVDWLLDEIRRSSSIQYTQVLAEKKVHQNVSELRELWKHCRDTYAVEASIAILSDVATRLN